MTWITVERKKPRAISGGVLLAVTSQKLRNGRMLNLVRIKLDAEVMREAGLRPGTRVDLLLGEGEDRGKIRLYQAKEAEGFRIAGYQSKRNLGGQLVLDASLLRLVPPPSGLPPTRMKFRVEPEFLEITVPRELVQDDGATGGTLPGGGHGYAGRRGPGSGPRQARGIAPTSASANDSGNDGTSLLRAG